MAAQASSLVMARHASFTTATGTAWLVVCS